MRPRVALLGALCAVLLAGCGHGSSQVPSSDVRHLVLTPRDLPSGFVPFAEAPTSTVDVQGTSRASLARFGRKGGWVERLRRSGGGKNRLLLVVSTVDVFGDAKGAQRDLEASANDFARQRESGLAKRVVVPQIGDGSVAAELLAPGGEKEFAVVWVERNASASVTAIGGGKLTLGAVAALARKQQEKLANTG